jgi:coenzyme F420-reducing hydrogenase beta subunit
MLALRLFRSVLDPVQLLSGSVNIDGGCGCTFTKVDSSCRICDPIVRNVSDVLVAVAGEPLQRIMIMDDRRRWERGMVRKLVLIGGTFLMLTLTTGCILNQYSSDPNTRMQQLINQSEDLRQIEAEWRRFWFNDQPSHLTPERVHGGII